jgi:hypothetical protein
VMPRRRHFRQDTVLGASASRAFGAVAVVAQGDAWGDGPVPVRVGVELRQLIPGSGPPVPTTLPQPLLVDVARGAYQYADPSGQMVSQPSGFGPEAVLAWLSAAGIDSANPRVREEARLAWLYGVRAGRRPRPAGSFNGGTSSSSTSGMGGPFGSVTVSEVANVEPARSGMIALLTVWGILLAAGLVYLWRQTAGRRAVEQPAGAAGAVL